MSIKSLFFVALAATALVSCGGKKGGSLADLQDTEHYWLWDLTASLRLNKLLKVYARGENLLAQRYEVNAGFPMPRATVMAGLEVNL